MANTNGIKWNQRLTRHPLSIKETSYANGDFDRASKSLADLDQVSAMRQRYITRINEMTAK